MKTKQPFTPEEAMVILRQLIDEKDQQIMRLQKALVQSEKRVEALASELDSFKPR